jgi:hypothetical protein
VNIRGAVVDGIKQHLLDESDNRSVVNFECRSLVNLRRNPRGHRQPAVPFRLLSADCRAVLLPMSEGQQ